MHEPRVAPMTSSAQQATAERARLIIEALLAAEVDLIFVCPGARSTPLVGALGRCADERLKRVVLHDERTAGFAAVGAARAGQRAAVVTTSGTAVANLAPAMTEAAVADLPIVVVTADRPWELHGRGANQTVPQATLFHGLDVHVLDLPAPPDGADDRLVSRQLDDALATRHRPVHINARFRKPLHPPDDARAVERRVTSRPRVGTPPPPDGAALATFVSGAQRGLVVVGELSLSQREGAEAIVARLGWPVVADITSGVARQVPPAFARRAPELAPDRVLWLGGRLTEPAVAQWLAGAGAEVWQVEDRPSRRDPDSLFDRSEPSALLDVARVLPTAPPLEQGFARALAAAADAWERTDPQGDGGALTEPAIARAVVEQLADDSVLLLGASMPVRDADRFARRLPQRTLVAANRGASGIDGQLGTALGLHLATRRPVTALLGDLTFLHDVGGLVALAQHSARVRLVVVNNDGGGIFSLLPLGSASGQLDPWFSAPHGRSAADIAAGFGVAAHTPTTLEALAKVLARPVTGVEVVEVRTDRAENAALHRSLDGLKGQAVRP